MSKKGRRHDGQWFDRALPFIEDFVGAPKGGRRDVIRRLAATQGIAENTGRRQLVALEYLLGKGIDLKAMTVRPAVLAIEAIGSMARQESGLDDEPLRRLLEGEGSVLEFRAISQSTRKDLGKPKLTSVPGASLRRIVQGRIDLRAHGTGKRETEFPGVVRRRWETSSGTLTVYCVSGIEKFWSRPNGRRLVEGAILRSAFTDNRTIVCCPVEIPALEEARAISDLPAERLEILRVKVTDDLP